MKKWLWIFIFVWIDVLSVQAQDNPLPPLEQITVENASQIQELKRYGNGILSGATAWSPDGKVFAIGGSIGIWLYKTDDLNSTPEFIDLDSWVYEVAFNPDNSQIAVLLNNGVHLLDSTTHKDLRTFPASDAFAFSPDNKFLAVGSHAAGEKFYGDPVAALNIIDLQTGDISTAYVDEEYAYSFVSQIQYTANDTLIFAVASYLGSYECEDTFPTTYIVGLYKGAISVLSSETITAQVGISRRRIVTGDFPAQGSLVSIYDLATGKTMNIPDNENRPYDITLSPDSHILVVNASRYNYSDYFTRLYDASTGETIATLNTQSMSHLQFSHDGKYLAGFDGKTLHLWDMDSFEEVVLTQSATTIDVFNEPLAESTITPSCEKSSDQSEVCSVLTPTGKQILYNTNYNGGWVKLSADTTSSEDLLYEGNVNAYVAQVFLSNDSTKLAFVVYGWCHCGYGSSYTTHVWDIGNNADYTSELFQVYTAIPGDMVFSSDNTLFITATGNGITLWNVTTGDQLNELPFHTPDARVNRYQSAVQEIAFNQENTILVSQGYDGAVRLWGVPQSSP